MAGIPFRAVAAAALAALVASCAAPEVELAPPAGAPAGFPAGRYEAALSRGDAVRAVDGSASVVRIAVGRSGPLAGMGHDHAIASRAVQGYVRCRDAAASGCRAWEADLYVALASMTVDQPRDREALGLEGEVPEDARQGTRSNMLSSLDAERYPWVRLHVAGPVAAAADDGRSLFDAEITLHGAVQRLRIAADVGGDGDELTARGRFEILQTDFGIEPFSVLGGSLAVADRLSVHFDIVATRLCPDSSAQCGVSP